MTAAIAQRDEQWSPSIPSLSFSLLGLEVLCLVPVNVLIIHLSPPFLPESITACVPCFLKHLAAHQRRVVILIRSHMQRVTFALLTFRRTENVSHSFNCPLLAAFGAKEPSRRQRAGGRLEGSTGVRLPSSPAVKSSSAN